MLTVKLLGHLIAMNMEPELGVASLLTVTPYVCAVSVFGYVNALPPTIVPLVVENVIVVPSGNGWPRISRKIAVYVAGAARDAAKGARSTSQPDITSTALELTATVLAVGLQSPAGLTVSHSRPLNWPSAKSNVPLVLKS